MQGELFELTVANLTRTSGTGRLRWTGIASDRWKYAIKRTADHPLLPGSEWFCHKLAEAVHLPTPTYRKLRLEEDGTLAFGSRWESEAKQWDTINPADRERYFRTGINVCRIIGLDLFLPNGDRNLGNFLWHLIDNTPAAMAFDYSEGWSMHGPIENPPPLRADCRTLMVMQWLKHIGALSLQDIGETLGRLTRLTPRHIGMIADTIPDEWQPPGGKSAIIEWWSAPKTVGRLAILTAQYPCAAVTTTPSSA